MDPKIIFVDDTDPLLEALASAGANAMSGPG
jgi:hypothetical protein